MKPLAPSRPPGASVTSQPIAIAVLNRGTDTHPGYTLDLTRLSFAPAASVIVRDIWANVTTTVVGSYTTRAVASHETVLLKAYLA